MAKGAVKETTVAVQVAKAADSLNGKGEDDHSLTLSTGVKLKVNSIPPLTMVEALTIFPRPEVPIYFDERLGREVENPDHPDYKERLQKYQLNYALGVMNAMILFGVEVVYVPKGFPKPEDDDWVEKISLVGLDTLPSSKNWRKLAWIKSVACAVAEDSNLLMERVGSASGVSEKDVAAASQAFRSKKG